VWSERRGSLRRHRGWFWLTARSGAVVGGALIRPDEFAVKVAERCDAALKHGALKPIDTRVEHVDDEGSRFSLRVVNALRRKGAAPAGGDPFLPPYEPELFVGELTTTHACLLNKYPVLQRHALVVTRAFEPQTDLLTEADFAAVLPVLQSAAGLVFYNAGPEAGASQPHKHLQWVPTPLDGGPGAVPLEAAILGGRLPVRHAMAKVSGDAAQVAGAYRALLQQLGALDAAYNLLFTREWMLVVPRRTERFEHISLNALAFAGSLFVKNDAELALLKRAGPMSALRAVVA
jgi:ATP adenylyltransferase